MFAEFNAEILIERHRQGRLAVAHIDPQADYDAPFALDRDTSGAFFRVNNFGKQLRRLKVPNYWAANALSEGVFPFASLQRVERSDRLPEACSIDPDIGFHSAIKILPSEIIAAKTDANVATNQAFVNLLRKRGQDTLLLTGMYYDACYTSSAIGLLMGGFNVIACPDATDCLPKQLPEFSKSLRALTQTSSLKGTLSHSSSAEVIGTLTRN